ncbi:MAG: hypothetical protein LQ343_000995 [Gyalolechia ehrenbergii]|nr:MAG: hypothetical protein LQ343_000995 [Gyalolechia ehrenbergii]
MEKGEMVEVPVKGRIMVDAAFFRENNPNYVRPRISGLTKKKSLNDGWFILVPEKKVKSKSTEPMTLLGDFDDAIQSRITLAVRYEPLTIATRKQVWASLLEKAVTTNGAAKYNPKDLDGLARKDLNGQQLRAPFADRFVEKVDETKHSAADISNFLAIVRRTHRSIGQRPATLLE